ncbi:MAG: hypothetical protein PVI33_03275 [Candidatus Omnitrophota bacterium]
MNKKQLAVALLTGILIALFFGLETTHTDYQGLIKISIDLSIYDKYIGSDISGPDYPSLGQLAYLGNYKYHLMTAAFLIGCLLIYRLRNKRNNA